MAIRLMLITHLNYFDCRMRTIFDFFLLVGLKGSEFLMDSVE